MANNDEMIERLQERAEKAETDAEFFRAEVKLRNRIGISQTDRDAIWAEATAAALLAAANAVADIIVERQADLHEAQNSFNEGAVDALQSVRPRILSITPQDTREYLANLIANAVARGRKVGCAAGRHEVAGQTDMEKTYGADTTR